jgi:hypothetical protein
MASVQETLNTIDDELTRQRFEESMPRQLIINSI